MSDDTKYPLLLGPSENNEDSKPDTTEGGSLVVRPESDISVGNIDVSGDTIMGDEQLQLRSAEVIQAGKVAEESDIDMKSPLKQGNSPATQKEEVDKNESITTTQGNGLPGSKKPSTRSQTKANEAATVAEREKEHRAAVNRVLQCKPRDYYQILALSDNAETSEIRDAYKKIAIWTHPDKNNDPEAAEVFKKVSTAYEVLRSAESRREFDNNRERFEPDQGLNAKNIFQNAGFDEDFAENAWGAESGGDESDEDNEVNEYLESPPDDQIRQLYAKATPYVNAFLGNLADMSSKSQIEKVNRRIQKKNQRHGVDAKNTAFSILVNSLGIISKDWQRVLRARDSGQDDVENVEKVKESLQTLKRRNHYPDEWNLPTSVDAEKRTAQAKWALGTDGVDAAKSSSEGNGKRREEIFSTSKGESSSKGKGQEREDTLVMPNDESFFQGKGQEREDTLFMPNGESSFQGKGKEREDTLFMPNGESSYASLAHKVVGGRTRDGDKILGYRPFFRTDRTGRTEVFGYQFLIERPGRSNPLELLSGTELGNLATEAYLALPDSEKKDMRDSATKYQRTDITRFETLVGFATKGNASQTSSGRKRPGYGLVKFKDGKQDILCRTALRNILGRTDADYEIGRYIDPTSIGELASTAISRNKITSRRHLRNVEQDTPETRSVPQLTVGDHNNENTELMKMLLGMQKTQLSMQEAVTALQSRVIAMEPAEL
ncbi:DnaJ subfamily C member 1 [Elasticomyces elasticus]|uniref:J domain-containing protein n=1 Tax=Exophiala sideris TaxID=1016849 RepID=A0ABR0IVL1_9EURO|nr:DnaJ subfamily C member 1 [Elasticomyces elasticus]KAK5021247.1 hypothetical protein LTS07_011162 [Exophiala sideris]KAK5030192.1 DnaJ subfamily C member 1 [Exophiala sideris]KAK5049150.1 hypothetical protein LTR69_011177 [Exophiala sideris]KAK5176422.1 hypothetical protein LTR44_011044 [Eurotiomycetes sp. CCFEE 6388]